jgi:histone deacetylase 6
MGSHPLLVIFHDPPTFQDNPDPVTGRRELHNTWLVSQSTVLRCLPADLHAKTDVTKKYIDWAVSHGFEVVDVNIPKIVSVENVSRVRSCIRGTANPGLSSTKAT